MNMYKMVSRGVPLKGHFDDSFFIAHKLKPVQTRSAPLPLYPDIAEARLKRTCTGLTAVKEKRSISLLRVEYAK